MIPAARWIALLAEPCHDLLQVGVSLLLQSTFLIALGLLAARRLAHRGPSLASMIQRATLGAVVVSAVLTLLAPGSLRPFWRVSLPTATLAAPTTSHRTAGGPISPRTSEQRPAADDRRPTSEDHRSTVAQHAPAHDPRPEREPNLAVFPGVLERIANGPGPLEAYLRDRMVGGDRARTTTAGRVYVGVVALWAVGAVGALLWLGLCQFQLARLARRSSRIRTGFAPDLVRDLAAVTGVRAPELRMARREPVLFLAGIVRPAIFLPPTYARDFDEPALGAVFLHELAHLARRDCAWNLLVRLVCAVGWLQPLLWRLRAEMEETAESCCDQAVVAGHCPPPVYASCLLDLAQRFSLTAPHPRCAWVPGAAGIGIVTFRSSLGRRVHRVLDRSFAELRPVSLRSRIAVGCVALALVAVGLRALAAPPAVTIRARDERRAALDLFRDDARLGLAAKITVAVQDRPLGALLADLSRDLDIPLAADARTADDKATLFLDQRPGGEVLALVAGHFGFHWERRKEGYLLTQTPASQQREAALRERDLREQLGAIEAKLRRAAQQASAPKEPLWQQLRALQAQIDALNKAPLAQRAERRLTRLYEQRQAVWEQIDPRRDASVAVYRSLTPTQVQRLVEGRELVLSTTDGTLALPTGRVVKQAFAREREGMKAQRFFLVPLFEALKAKPATNMEVAVRVRLLDLRISDEDRDTVGPPERDQNRIRLEFFFNTTPAGAEVVWNGGMPWWVDGVADRPKRASTQTTDPVLLRPVTLRFPKPEPGRATIDPETLARAYEVFGVWPAGLRTVGEIAAALHQATGLEVVADSFVRARVAPDLFQEPRPPVAILDALAEELEYTWRKEGNTIFLRNARYYRDRSEEVPERVLAPWRQIVRRQGNATLDDLAALAAAVTEPQARGLHQFWGWYFEGLPTLPPVRGSGGFYGSAPHLRFWASLSPLQRRRALMGDAVLGSQLTLTQRRLLEEAAMSIGTNDCTDLRLPGNELTTTLNPTQVQSGALYIKRGSLLPENEDPLKVISYYLSYHGPGETQPARSFEIQLIAPQGYGRP
jgi:beta-lactamase regulating signal transducer with metallopeptidase domain